MECLEKVVLFVLQTLVLSVDIVLQSMSSAFGYISRHGTYPIYETLRDHNRKEPGGAFVEISGTEADDEDDNDEDDEDDNDDNDARRLRTKLRWQRPGAPRALRL